MTDEQLEAAARELCRLRGIDPDQMVREYIQLDYIGGPHKSVRHDYWHDARDEIKRHLDIERAIQVGRDR